MQGQSEAASRALVGLLVHSVADGFAVGASSVSTSASLSFLVAVAMVLHKVPSYNNILTCKFMSG
jgi:zinc transporter 9